MWMWFLSLKPILKSWQLCDRPLLRVRGHTLSVYYSDFFNFIKKKFFFIQYNTLQYSTIQYSTIQYNINNSNKIVIKFIIHN